MKRFAFPCTAVLVLCMTGSFPLRVDAETTLEVSADQTATVVGQFDSLRVLIQNLCERGQAELRAYDADDRTVTADFRSEPLIAVVRGLLRNENYLLGEAADAASGKPRMAWVHVSGNQSGTVTQGTARSISRQMGFGDDAGADAALEAHQQRQAVEEAAARSMAEKFFSDDNKRAQFLEADPQMLAESVQSYPDATRLVRRLVSEQTDAATVKKLTEVLAAVEKLNAR